MVWIFGFVVEFRLGCEDGGGEVEQLMWFTFLMTEWSVRTAIVMLS